MKKLKIIEEILAAFEKWIDLNTNEKLTVENKKQFEVIIGTALGTTRADGYNPLIVEDMRSSFHSTSFPCDPKDSIDYMPNNVKMVVEYGFEMDPRSQYAGNEICLYDITRSELGPRIKYVQSWILKSDFEKEYQALEDGMTTASVDVTNCTTCLNGNTGVGTEPCLSCLLFDKHEALGRFSKEALGSTVRLRSRTENSIFMISVDTPYALSEVQIFTELTGMKLKETGVLLRRLAKCGISNLTDVNTLVKMGYLNVGLD